MKHTADQVRANCASGARCGCAEIVALGDVEHDYWNCESWGRSSLPAPNIHSAYADPLSKVKSHNDEMNKRLGDIRHADPRKHLRRKGASAI